MSIEIKVPTVGESISEVTLVKWHKKDGEYAERDEVIAELESEKATFYDLISRAHYIIGRHGHAIYRCKRSGLLGGEKTLSENLQRGRRGRYITVCEKGLETIGRCRGLNESGRSNSGC